MFLQVHLRLSNKQCKMADLQMYADHFLNEMIDEAVLGVAYEAHRSFTKGTLFLDDNLSEDEDKYKIVVEKGLDIFGQPISGSKKTVECLCPNCNRNMAASRFAPHLEKCMGMGRNSSRIASQRIANSGKFSSMNDALGEDDPDDINDVDWLACETTSTRKTKKRKTERCNGSPRTSKSLIARSKTSSNSPKLSHTESKSDIHDANDNVMVLPTTTRQGSEQITTRSENINQTVTLWQQHINATLTGQESSRSSKSPSTVSAASSNVKKIKKTVKTSHCKKSKKRHLPAQHTMGLS